MYAVRLYKSVLDKPIGIPDEWPAEVADIGEALELPPEYLASKGWMLMSQEDLDTQKATNRAKYNNWFNDYKKLSNKTVPIQTIVERKIINAQVFGNSIILEFAAENVLLGYDLTDIKNIIVLTSKVLAALQTGSLYVALDELELVEENAYISQERKTKYRNKLQSYLGIPLT